MSTRFTKTNIVDRVVEFAKRIQLTLVAPTADVYDFVAVPGTETLVGTVLDNALLQPMTDEIELLSQFSSDAKTGIDLTTGSFTLQLADYTKGLIVVATAHETNSLILPTNYNYRYVIYNADAVNTLLVKKSAGVAVSIPPRATTCVAYNGSQYVIVENARKLAGAFTLADYGLDNADFSGLTWAECAELIIDTCLNARVIQFIDSTSSFTNISSALVTEELANAGTLRYEAGRNDGSPGAPNRFEYNENNANNIYYGFYDNEWRGWNLTANNADVVAAAHLTGEVKEIAFAAIPSGWLLCDGSAVSRTTYANLFAKISTVYGVGNGSTTFNVPNKKGSVGAGYDAAVAAFNTLGKTGGVVEHALSVAELAAHNHSVSSSGAHTHTSKFISEALTLAVDQSVQIDRLVTNAEAIFTNSAQSVPSGGSHTHTTQNKGSGNAHTNLQPYQVFNYIIKT